MDCELPVVSEELWDHFTFVKFPSADAFTKMFKSDDWKRAAELRRAAVDASMAVPGTALTE